MTPMDVAYQTARLRVAAAVDAAVAEGWTPEAVLYALLTTAHDIGRRLCTPDGAASAMLAARDAIATGRDRRAA